MAPLADPFKEAQRILSIAKQQNLLLRLMGGVGIGLCCPTIQKTNRRYRDLDFVARSGFGRQLEFLFQSLEYLADETFNKLNGADRLIFWDETNQRQIDVMIDQLDMSHVIDLRRRLDLNVYTLTPADLLLSKLQIFEISERDLLDIAVLLIDHQLTDDDQSGINVSYLAELFAADWGLYHTCHINLERILLINELLDRHAIPMPADRIAGLLKRMHDVPKTMSWSLRAKIGERIKWYKSPEEIG